MCGRYCLDDAAAKEIERMVHCAAAIQFKFQTKDIHPKETAPVLLKSNEKLTCSMQRWGFPGFRGKQVIINARSESAQEKRTFWEGVAYRRIVVPAAWFYEWNKNKEKNIFYRKEKPALFMAGIYNHYADEDRFVILTTQANASMKPVHDRMPLILEESEIIPWIFHPEKTKDFLHKVPGLLDRRMDFEQMSLFEAGV